VVTVELVESWGDGLEDVFALVAARFSRMEPRRRSLAYVRGLLAPLERRNGWTLAEQAGDGSPDGMQALLCSPCWDPDAVRDDVRGYVVGSEGFIARLDKDRNLMWIVALTDSNPFEKAEVRGLLATFTNNPDNSVTVNLDHPDFA
jgi:hypothetical protein